MFPDSGPTARALLTLELLQSRPGITAAQLADRLGVTERAARRSVATLKEVGVPVESVRGPGGGYRLGRGLRLPPLLFSASEALGLVMAVLDGHHAVADPDQPVGAALGKLIDALPETVSRQAALLREHVRASPNLMAAPPDQTILAELVAAVATHRRVEIGYRREEREWTEQVDPWGLAVRYGRWYLVCHSHRAQAVRTYRVDRVVAATPQDETFDPPENVDAVELLERHLAIGWEHPTRVVINAALDQVRPFIRASVGELSPHPADPDRCVLEGSTSNPDSYAAEYLAPLPFTFHVEGGDEVRAAMARLAQRLAASVDTEP